MKINEIIERYFWILLVAGILLLTAMPAGVSTPALAEILKGNISLAMSIVILTQVIAPFTVPLLFWFIGTKGLDINKLLVLKDITTLAFIPLIAAQVIKRYFMSVIAFFIKTPGKTGSHLQLPQHI